MAQGSLYKCTAALLVMAFYIFLFGITGEVEGVTREGDDLTENINPGTSLIDSPTSGDETSIEETREPPITKYETGINSSNYPKPGFADYPAQTTAPFYYGDVADMSVAETQSADTLQSTTTTQDTSQTVTTPQSTTTPQTTTPAQTTTPVIQTTQTTTESRVSEETDSPVSNETETTTDSLNNSETMTVLNSGKSITDTAFNIISRIVQNEIGSSFDTEAIKAQAVASYTYVKKYNESGAVPEVALSSVASEKIKECVSEVLGQAIYYDGALIQAVYCASSAGYTSSSLNVWGVDYPYLKSRDCALDQRYDPNYGVIKNYTASEFSIMILEKTGIDLRGDPSQWIKIVNYIDTVYVGDITIGGKSSYKSNGTEIKLTGRNFRERICGSKELKSAAFTVSYDADKDMFTFTTYGYGHGVGLSQNGANILAKYEGYTYKDILKFYYQGTSVY